MISRSDLLFFFCLGYPLRLHSSSASDLVITVSDGSNTSQALQLFLNSLSPHVCLLPSPQTPQQAGLLYIPFPPPPLKIRYLWEWSASQLLRTSLGCCGPMPVPLSQVNPFSVRSLLQGPLACLESWRACSLTSQGPPALEISQLLAFTCICPSLQLFCLFHGGGGYDICI